jgi:hypothetical protein
MYRLAREEARGAALRREEQNPDNYISVVGECF